MTLDLHCTKHPKYAAIYAPRTYCDACRKLYQMTRYRVLERFQDETMLVLDRKGK